VTRTDAITEHRQVGTIERDTQTPGLDDLGLRLAEIKTLLDELHVRLVQEQIEKTATLDAPLGPETN
jgi:hypothetical protein